MVLERNRSSIHDAVGSERGDAGTEDTAAHEDAAFDRDDVDVDVCAWKKAALAVDERASRSDVHDVELAADAQPKPRDRLRWVGGAARRAAALTGHGFSHVRVDRS
jgi:hypothetical protein